MQRFLSLLLLPLAIAADAASFDDIKVTPYTRIVLQQNTAAQARAILGVASTNDVAINFAYSVGVSNFLHDLLVLSSNSVDTLWPIGRWGAVAGTDVTSNFQAAAQSGHSLWIPEGVFTITNTITFTNGIKVKAAGMGRTIFIAAITNHNVAAFIAGKTNEFDGFTITGPYTNTLDHYSQATFDGSSRAFWVGDFNRLTDIEIGYAGHGFEVIGKRHVRGFNLYAHDIRHYGGTAAAFHVTGEEAGFLLNSLTIAGTTATATTPTEHGYITGDLVYMLNASNAVCNGEFTITVTSPTNFTYALAATAGSPDRGGTISRKKSVDVQFVGLMAERTDRLTENELGAENVKYLGGYGRDIFPNGYTGQPVDYAQYCFVLDLGHTHLDFGRVRNVTMENWYLENVGGFITALGYDDGTNTVSNVSVKSVRVRGFHDANFTTNGYNPITVDFARGVTIEDVTVDGAPTLHPYFIRVGPASKELTIKNLRLGTNVWNEKVAQVQAGATNFTLQGGAISTSSTASGSLLDNTGVGTRVEDVRFENIKTATAVLQDQPGATGTIWRDNVFTGDSSGTNPSYYIRARANDATISGNVFRYDSSSAIAIFVDTTSSGTYGMRNNITGNHVFNANGNGTSYKLDTGTIGNTFLHNTTDNQGHTVTDLGKGNLSGWTSYGAAGFDKSPNLLFYTTGTTTVTNTGVAGVETSLIGSGNGSRVIIANYFRADGANSHAKGIRWYAAGDGWTAVSPDTARVRFYLDATNCLDTTARTMVASIAGGEWECSGELHSLTTGTSGTADGTGRFLFSDPTTAAGYRWGMVNSSAVPLNTTVDHTADLKLIWGGSTAGDSLRLKRFELYSE